MTTQCSFCVLSFSTDWRFPSSRSKEIVDALITAKKNVVSAIIESEHGHDSFLLPIDRYFNVLGTYLRRLVRTSADSRSDLQAKDAT